MKKFDVLIVGAGIFGVTTAYYIKKQNPRLSVLLIDRNGQAGEGNTCRSAAGVRNTFSSPENQLLTNASIDQMKAIEMSGFKLNLRLIGYLWLMNKTQYGRATPAIAAMKRNGIEFTLLDSKELRRVPGLNVDAYDDEECKMMGLDPVACGLLGHNCGSVDPGALVAFYEEGFREMGGETRYSTDAKSLLWRAKEPLGLDNEPVVWQDAHVAGVETDKGEILADRIILATGAWASELLDPLGVDSHIRPKKRQFAQVKGKELEPFFNVKGFNDLQVLPFTILHKAGIYIKPEPREECMYVGCADDLGRRFDLDMTGERDYFQNEVLPVLMAVFPQFERARIENIVAGSYAYNTIDKNPYVFRAFPNVIVVTGDSGSGIMKSDSIGRIAAALHFDEEYALLYPDRPFKVSALGTKERAVTPEQFII